MANDAAEHEVTFAFKVTGRVQGVGFRWWVRQQARDAELSGCVWNCPDGSVEVTVRGPSEAVGALADLLSVGPRGAAVKGVVASATEPFVGWDEFRIGAPPAGG